MQYMNMNRLYVVTFLDTEYKTSFYSPERNVIPITTANTEYVTKFNAGLPLIETNDCPKVKQTETNQFQQTTWTQRQNPKISLSPVNPSRILPPLLQLTFSHRLSEFAKEEFDTMTTSNIIYVLPRRPSISLILKSFVQMLPEEKLGLYQTVIDQLPAYFNTFLPRNLLLTQERPQHTFWMKVLRSDLSNPGLLSLYPNIREIRSYCDLYGGEHLLRLLIQLPFFIDQMEILKDPGFRYELRRILNCLLDFLSRFSDDIFSKPDFTPSPSSFDLSLYLSQEPPSSSQSFR
ncbi:putative MRG domain containing protein [Blattamonas nauphoetae]|uniref:MRG domain containing protein n=1 Tax=Blattamonas nauphoetae TaxID=2049346 RepID=A0ABQ9YLY3_9EUKA|nr:putative MRG domain containing protein [Blattamonas nauphoetae]